MTDKNVFFAFIGGFLFAAAGALIGAGILAGINAVVHLDHGDDGVGLLLLSFIVITGIIGFFMSARWLQNRNKQTV